MALVLFGVEGGIRGFSENADPNDQSFEIIEGTAIPGGDAGPQDAAPLPSLYFRKGTSEVYRKIGTANSTADWEELGQSGVQIDELSWRNEKVCFATDDTLSAGNVDITTITDNEGMVIGDVNVGEFAIGDRDGTPTLFEITAKPGGNDITLVAATQVIADNDTFMVQKYLPDSPAAQEGQAIVHFPLAAGPGVKVGDVNWNFADGIGLAATFTPANGVVSASDTVNSAIENLVAIQNDMLTALGISIGDTDMGTYGGDIISDNVNQVTVNSELEAAIEAISKKFSGTVPQSTPTVVDSVVVDNVQRATWIVTARDTANPNRTRSLRISAIHNGHAGADATGTPDRSVSERINEGNVNLQATATLTGAAGAQVMNLQLTTNEASGISYTVERVHALELAG